METLIQDYLRIVLSAKHKATGQIIHFPLIHIAVEKFNLSDSKVSFIATCMEYGQAYESENPENAVAGLINLMHDYFITVLRSEGKDNIFDTLEQSLNEELWGKIRRFMAEKYKANLHFVERSFKTSSREELKKLANDLIDPSKEMDELVPKAHHDKVTKQKDTTIKKQSELIQQILELVEAKNKKIEAQIREISKLKSGLEGSQEEWLEEQPEIRSAIPVMA
ncbi:hypothetical protein JWG44_05470 [Leptospira sp. 201903071]|uniref:hypothetical protein n=1 Tax=Leptospira ainazelensis TaxID=2810034 RepID=UPI001964106F|nr:hypothetical protein [Leptospira ainazelensis]MBM9499699.1 hypothetical protein [Leptospira ainazelensis]